MCVTAAIAVVGLASSAMSAKAQSDAGKAHGIEARIAGNAADYEGQLDRALRNMEADDIMTAAQQEAHDIRRQQMQIRGQMLVAQSGSGVVIGEGSAQAAMDQLDTLAASDTLAALYSGVNKAVSVRHQGEMSAQAGQNNLLAANRSASSIERASRLQAAGTLLGGVAQAGGAYYKATK
ncbi:MAG: hypothetical protein Q7V53_07215 [Caldisericota bacterium]|nr:hypothetical protein [Caldisericota bacterium]